MNKVIALTPAQHTAAQHLSEAIQRGEIFSLSGEPGSGKSTVLRHIQTSAGGAYAGARSFMATLSRHHPRAIEEAFLDWIEAPLAHHDLLLVDDLHLIVRVAEACVYPRANLLDLALNALIGETLARGKRLLFAFSGDAPAPVRRYAHAVRIATFAPADYEAVCRAYLPGDTAGQLDYGKIHRFAPMLSAQQLKNSSLWLREETSLSTDRFLDYLTEQDLISNVEIEEVAPVSWSDLKGVDDVIEALEAKIALPFENDALTAELQLKPKRGVLLAGPPGTGKTTIGRALAHRLKSKFFLIDGTMVAGTSDFYGQVSRVFEAAQNNAPSIIFIDDADVIFENENHFGFHRYLLTMLDGLKSKSAERVCVMMTAMNPASLPPPVLRSGRIELWLETRLPDRCSRAMILRELLASAPPLIAAVDAGAIAAESDGLTGADLKSVAEDAKLLLAHDKASGKPLQSIESYFRDAIATVRNHRRTYARKKPLALAQIRFGFPAVPESVR